MVMRWKWVFNCELVGLETFEGCPSGPVQKHIRPSSGLLLHLAQMEKASAIVSRLPNPVEGEGGQRRQSRKPSPSLSLPVARSRDHHQREGWDMGLLSPQHKSNRVRSSNAILSVHDSDKEGSLHIPSVSTGEHRTQSSKSRKEKEVATILNK